MMAHDSWPPFDGDEDKKEIPSFGKEMTLTTDFSPAPGDSRVARARGNRRTRAVSTAHQYVTQLRIAKRRLDTSSSIGIFPHLPPAANRHWQFRMSEMGIWGSIKISDLIFPTITGQIFTIFDRRSALLMPPLDSFCEQADFPTN